MSKKSKKGKKVSRFRSMSETDIIMEMGWDSDTVASLMNSFIVEQGLTEEYLRFLAETAENEENEAGTL